VLSLPLAFQGINQAEQPTMMMMMQSQAPLDLIGHNAGESCCDGVDRQLPACDPADQHRRHGRREEATPHAAQADPKSERRDRCLLRQCNGEGWSKRHHTRCGLLDRNGSRSDRHQRRRDLSCGGPGFGIRHYGVFEPLPEGRIVPAPADRHDGLT
jgi:hypothetical protein